MPTWCPFRLQFYCNGHSWLARTLAREGIDFASADNAFVRIADLARAQALADAFKPERACTGAWTATRRLCCPVGEVFGQTLSLEHRCRPSTPPT